VIAILDFLDRITPLWGIFATASVVVVLHSWLLWKSTRNYFVELYVLSCYFIEKTLPPQRYFLGSINILTHCIRIGSEHLSIIFIHSVFAGLYFVFWLYTTPIEVRGPLVRFALEFLFLLQFSRGAYSLMFKQLKQGNHPHV
jgi:hypothetical protein